jgi:pantothenate kinase
MIEHNVSVNGIEVNAVYSERTVNELFYPLLKKLSDMHRTKGSRILVMLAAPPGAGKSTLLSFLEMLANEHRDMDDIQVIGMDGFHRRQEYLQTHYVTRNGRQISMVDIKGAPVTFDLDKLTERVKKFQQERFAAGRYMTECCIIL